MCVVYVSNYYVYFLSLGYHNDDDNSVIGYIVAGLLAFILTIVLVIGIIVAVIIRKKSVNQSPQTALATPPQTSEVQYMYHSDPSQADVIIKSCPNSA